MWIYVSWFLYDNKDDGWRSDFTKGIQITFSNKDRRSQVSAQISFLTDGSHEVWYHGMPTFADRRQK